MARSIFPWIFLLSTALALSFVMLGRFKVHARSRLGVVVGGLSLLAFLAALVTATVGLSGDSGAIVWSTEFFSLSSSGPVVKLGLELAFFPLIVCWGALVLFAHFYFLEPAFARPQGNEKRRFADGVVYESAILGFSAIAMAWLSSSLWTALLAQMLAAIAGGRVLTRLSVSNSDLGPSFALASLSYIRERGVGIALVGFGAAIAAVSGASLDWEGMSSQELPRLGILLVILGTLIQMQLFPAIGWGVFANQRHPVPEKVSLLIGMPSAWAGFAVLYRATSAQSDIGEIQFLSTLIFVLLNALSALGSQCAQGAFSLLSSALIGVSAAGLAFAGPRVSGTLFIVTQLVLWGSVSFLGGTDELRQRVFLRRVLVGLLVVAAFGGPGFASAAAFQSLIASSGSALGLSLFLICWAALSMAFMRLLVGASMTTSQDVAKELGLFYRIKLPWQIAPVALLTLLTLSVLWCGDPLGSFSSDVGAVGPDWSGKLLGHDGVSVGDSFFSATWAWMAALVISLAIGAPERLSRAELKFLSFPAEGYRLGSAFGWLFETFRISVDHISSLPGRAPFVAGWSAICSRVRDLCAATARADHWMQGLLDRGVRGLIEVPAKALQLIHSGSIQLYLLFTVGFVLAMLLHFFRQMSP